MTRYIGACFLPNELTITFMVAAKILELSACLFFCPRSRIKGKLIGITHALHVFPVYTTVYVDLFLFKKFAIILNAMVMWLTDTMFTYEIVTIDEVMHVPNIC